MKQIIMVSSILVVSLMVVITTGILLTKDGSDSSSALYTDLNQTDLLQFYENVKQEQEQTQMKNGRRAGNNAMYQNSLDFEVYDIMIREDNNFLQGLYISPSGKFIESCGLYGESKVQYLKQNEQILEGEDTYQLDDSIFGEGITINPSTKEWLVLTWRSDIVLRFDQNIDYLGKIPLFSGAREGWGITNDTDKLYVSDGSSSIFVVDPETYQTLSSFKVTLNDRLIDNLNELEFVNGYLYANVWYKDYILKIDPSSGIAIQKYDMSLLKETNRQFEKEYFGTYDADVLNGIAYDWSKNEFLVSGKNWRLVYRVSLIDNI